MTTKTRQISSHAAAAKAIRRVLKDAFPSITFRVRARSYSMGDAVDIDWTDGPTTRQVDALVSDFEYGHFDGMIDLYEVSNRRDDIPQVKYVQTQRSMSATTNILAMNHVNDYYQTSMKWDADRNWIDAGTDDWVAGGGFWASTLIHQYTYKRSCVCADCHTIAEITDRYCAECGSEINEII